MLHNILIRCDASKEIGLGHLSRCLVLAKKFRQRGDKVIFAIRENSLAIQRLQEERFEFFLPSSNSYDRWLQKIIDDAKISIFIGDVRDNLPTKTIQHLKSKNILTIALDEPSEYAKECDISFYPPHAQIKKESYKGKIYQGFEYVVLRDEFYKPDKKLSNKKSHTLVMMGGTDAHNLSYKVVQQLLSNKIDTDISLIISKNHPDYKKLSTIAPNVKLYSNIKNMATFLTQIDFAIISFGVSAYELVAMGIPAYHICLNDDHYSASEFFEKNGYAKRRKIDEIESIKKEEILSFIKTPIHYRTISCQIISKIEKEKSYVISVGAGKAQLPLILEIKRLGYKVLSFDLDADAPGKKDSDIFYNISSYDYKQLLKRLAKDKIDVCGVLTRSTGMPTVSVASIAKHYNLKSLDITNATLFSNKALSMKRFNQLKIPSPQTKVLDSLESLQSIKFHFPIFVKPSKTVESHASMHRCNNQEELIVAFLEAQKTSQTSEVNVEEYLIGRDVASIDFIFNNKIIHIATIGELSSGEPSFDGFGWYTAPDNYHYLARATIKLMKNKLHVKNGFLQTAMKINSQQKSAKIYEVHTEIGGDRVNDIFIPYILSGYNIFKENIMLAIGVEPKPIKCKQKYMILLFVKKIERKQISLKNYTLRDDVLLKEFETMQELEKELDFLKEHDIYADNHKGKEV